MGWEEKDVEQVSEEVKRKATALNELNAELAYHLKLVRACLGELRSKHDKLLHRKDSAKLDD